MRGLWDHEQPLSPTLLRSAMGLLSGLLAVWAAITILGSIGALFTGRFGAAIMQLSAGLALPFAIWLAVRILADLLVVQNRLLEQMEESTRPGTAGGRSGSSAQASAAAPAGAGQPPPGVAPRPPPIFPDPETP